MNWHCHRKEWWQAAAKRRWGCSDLPHRLVRSALSPAPLGGERTLHVTPLVRWPSSPGRGADSSCDSGVRWPSSPFRGGAAKRRWGCSDLPHRLAGIHRARPANSGITFLSLRSKNCYGGIFGWHLQIWDQHSQGVLALISRSSK